MVRGWLQSFPYSAPREIQVQTIEVLEREWDNYSVFVIRAPTAFGKCHRKGQGIIMYDGSICKVEDIRPGDLLMGPDSTPRKVLELYRGESRMVQVTPMRGTSFVVTENHILPVIRYTSTGRYDRVGGKQHKLVSENIEARDWLAFSSTRKHCTKLWKPENVQFPTPNEPALIPPYILGLWLGDGTSSSPAITTMDDDIGMIWSEWGESIGCTVRVASQSNNKAATINLRVDRGQKNPATDLLRHYDLLDNKHVPRRYLLGSRQERLELLAGLSDTDGNWNTRGSNFEITQVRRELANQILFLVRSLGFAAQMDVRTINGTDYYRVSGSTLRAEEIPVRCRRKTQPISSKSNQKHTGFTVTQLGVEQYYGFELDGDHLYLLDDFTVTHNTSLSKTLHNVHRSATTITPTNQLVDQYLQEFPDTRTLARLDSYWCEKWDRPCPITRAKLRNFCNEKRDGCKCAASQDLAEAKYRRGPGVYNYHTYMAHRIYRDVLIVDEAHNLIPALRDRAAQIIWQHDYRYPQNMWSYEQMLQFIDSMPEKKRKHKKIAAWREAVKFQVPKYIAQRTQEPFNGKGTRRGEPEMRDCIKLLPVDISDQPPIMWPSDVKKIVLLSATIGEKDIEALGLGRNRRVLYIDCKSPIPPERRPIIALDTVSVNYISMQRGAVEKLANEINNIAEHHKGQKGVIHATYTLARDLRRYLDGSRFIFHGKLDKQEKYKQFRESPAHEGAILVASGMYEGIDLPEDLGRWQVIAKIPWMSLANPAVKHLAELDPDWYNWECLKTTIQACGRVCRTPTDQGVTYCLDSSFRKLIRNSIGMCPEWFRDAIDQDWLEEVVNE